MVWCLGGVVFWWCLGVQVLMTFGKVKGAKHRENKGPKKAKIHHGVKPDIFEITPFVSRMIPTLSSSQAGSDVMSSR